MTPSLSKVTSQGKNRIKESILTDDAVVIYVDAEDEANIFGSYLL
jgi:hypothetical protein